jgi:outer membrane protein OmpA-like peptidoglycan-associated protein
MKNHYPVLFAVALFGQSFAQPATPPVIVAEETVVETVPNGVTGREVVVETATPQLRRIDRAMARRQLGMAPQALPTPAPGTVVETTETTTTVDVPGFPPRVYNSETSVVLVEGRELPYLTIPVLFVKETDELLDTESRTAIEETSMAIQDILKTDPTAVFDIEGHTSTDGTAELNLELSSQRARRVFAELTQRYAIPSTALSAHGYGENYPKFPSGSEAQMVLDRRVLVVRVK